jgi:hypothetical protein
MVPPKKWTAEGLWIRGYGMMLQAILVIPKNDAEHICPSLQRFGIFLWFAVYLFICISIQLYIQLNPKILHQFR